MSQSTDIASTVGTWVAAGLALLALIGVVGPLIIWRASKSMRSHALNALDAGAAENGGFVDRGIWAGPNSRVFRRVRALNLKDEPPLDSLQLSFDGGRKVPNEASASWVQFSCLLQAYKFQVRKGDNLIIEDSHAWLPLKKSWILVVGLAGRFGSWQDKGKLATKIATGTSSKQARPGRSLQKSGSASYRLPRGHVLERRSMSDTPGWMTSRKLRAPRRPWDNTGDSFTHGRKSYSPIHGITGVLHVSNTRARNTSSADDREYIFFSRHRVSQTGELEPDTLGIDKLFWLAVGCLPSSDKKVFCLGDVEDVTVEPAAPLPGTPDFHMPPVSPTVYDRHTRNTRVHFDGDSDDSSSGTDFQGPVPTPVTYVVASPSHTTTANNARSDLDPWTPRAFRLSIFNERTEDLSALASIVKAEGTGTVVYSLEEVSLDDKAQSQLKVDSSGTYISHKSPWVRLGRGKSSFDTFTENRVIQRVDAQLLAQALLRLPLSPHGYLVSATPSACKLMLSAASDSLPQLLTRLIWGAQVLGLQDDLLDELLLRMTAMYDATEPLKLPRKYFRAIFDLDKALELAIGQQRANFGEIIGILMITSPEFRSLIAQSARHLQETATESIVLDIEGKTVNIASVMNFTYKFPIGLDELYDVQTIGTGKVSITHAEVMLMCQKAALRSAMLETSLDSSPLFTAMSNMKDVIYMG